MDQIISTTFYVSLVLGTVLLVVAAGNQVFRKESPMSFLFVGLALVALPLASSIKVGPQGAELQIRSEIAAVEAKLEAIAEVKTDSQENPLADRYLALVMYSDNSVVDKNEVIHRLKGRGFLASSVATDYSELGSEKSHYETGEAYIKYRKGLEDEALKIKAMLESVNGMTRIVTKEVKSFRTGDIQIALF